MDTVAEVVRAGAEILVAGNAVFGKGDAKVNAQALLEAARSASLQTSVGMQEALSAIADRCSRMPTANDE